MNTIADWLVKIALGGLLTVFAVALCKSPAKADNQPAKTTRLDRKTLTDLMGEANPYLATATGAFWILENAQKKGDWNEFAKQVAYISKMAKESPEKRQAVAIVATAVYLLEDDSRQQP